MVDIWTVRIRRSCGVRLVVRLGNQGKMVEEVCWWRDA